MTAIARELPFNDKVINLIFELKAPKNQYNSFGKYKYRSAEDILEAVKPLAFKYGLIPQLSDEVVLIGDRIYVKATASLTDGTNTIQATGYAREPQTKKGMDDSQITGTASSYARKYAMNGLYQIDDTKDADTDEYTNQTRNKPVKKQQASKTITSNDIAVLNTLIDDLIRVVGKTKEDLQNALNGKLGVNKTIDKYTADEYGKALHLVKEWQKLYAKKD